MLLAIVGISMHQVRYVEWSAWLLDRILDWEDPSEDDLGPLRDYIHGHHRSIKAFTDSNQIWERKG